MDRYKDGIVSIIIPTYNNDKYLGKCLDSVLNQNYDNCEIIVVDDGSTDNTENVIKKYKNTNILFLKKENGGLASARNYGLEYATGEFVFFLDSDDYIEKDSITNLIKEVKDYDIVVGRYRYVNNDGIINIQPISNFKVYDLKNIESKDLFIYLFYSGYGINACNKIIRRKIIDESNTLFQDNHIIFAEDLLFNSKLIAYLNKVKIIDKITYNYYQNEESITHTYKKNLDLRYANLVNDYNKYKFKRNDLLVFLICNAINCISVQEKDIITIKKHIDIFKKNIHIEYKNKKYIDKLPANYRLDYKLDFVLLNKSTFLLAIYQKIKKIIKKRR